MSTVERTNFQSWLKNMRLQEVSLEEHRFRCNECGTEFDNTTWGMFPYCCPNGCNLAVAAADYYATTEEG